ncbi:MAG: site-specific DNA-methyltransferase [Magnetococcales bacterium]|nr:site-specific DNA-methyltransferase [Nitrospirota bacterium]
MAKSNLQLITIDQAVVSVFSGDRDIISPKIKLPKHLILNTRLKMDALTMLSDIPSDYVPVVFFDPQHRGVYDKMQYGNEETSRNARRVMIPQMTERDIHKIIKESARILVASGHLFLWIDKFNLCNGFRHWLDGTTIDIVDMITWHKQRIGLGYRTRHKSEFLLILQKQPRRAKGVWKLHNIPDVWEEKTTSSKQDPHCKPIDLQSALIEAVTNDGDLVIDPAAGSFSIMESCKLTGRSFLGCDIRG